jgi:N-acylneuraminate cytidylyltransferase
VLVLQPTSPLRISADILNAVALADATQCDSVAAVTEAPLHPVFAKKIDDQGMLQPFVLEEQEGLRRQDVSPPAYCRNGAIYLARRAVVMEGNSLYGTRIRPYIMPPERSVDIDTPLDFALAETLIAST